jgi:hypothetical protein
MASVSAAVQWDTYLENVTVPADYVIPVWDERIAALPGMKADG